MKLTSKHLADTLKPHFVACETHGRMNLDCGAYDDLVYEKFVVCPYCEDALEIKFDSHLEC